MPISTLRISGHDPKPPLMTGSYRVQISDAFIVSL
jgi:hypothetical protein